MRVIEVRDNVILRVSSSISSLLIGIMDVMINSFPDIFLILTLKSRNRFYLLRLHYRIFKTTYMLTKQSIILTMLSLEIGHLMTSSFGVICSQMSSPFCKHHSVSKLTPFCFHPVLTAFSLVGQALTLLVAVSSMCYHTSTPALSTSSSSRGFTPFGWDISS